MDLRSLAVLSPTLTSDILATCSPTRRIPAAVSRGLVPVLALGALDIGIGSTRRACPVHLCTRRSPSPQRLMSQSLAKQGVNSMVNDSAYVVEGDGATTSMASRLSAVRLGSLSTRASACRTTLRSPSSHCSLLDSILSSTRTHCHAGHARAFAEQLRPASFRAPFPPRPIANFVKSVAVHMRSTASAEKTRSSPMHVFIDAPSKSFAMSLHDQTVLREVQRSTNLDVPTPPPVLSEIKPFTPFSVELKTSKQDKNVIGLPARPRVTSSTRRAALGWSKRTGKSRTQDFKEDSIVPT
ncbi:hypothetical protein LXA43DRAFT_133265 [Ganoderma leucocontextum]|nr:hypothetical protein LXA43DRAFT_133207 [Ganoderma leucocontextum]KAI1794280.1 hypothetical protein LXA43DRAFT_133265 [Ganoderma leucocontextum]